MQQNNGFRRCRRAIAALAGASLVAAALTVSNLPQAAAAPSEPVVHDHGVPGLADIYNGTTASPDGGTYNVGYQVVSDTNRAVLVTKSKADGSLDTAFGTDGRAVIDLVKTFHETVTTNPGAKEVARGVTVDKLGRILVVGEVEGDQSSAATASDTDVFVARVHPNGNLDTSYGTNGGWTRINLSDGIHPTGGTNAADAAGYDIFVRPNQKAIFSAAIGTDSNGTRTARDAAAVQLSANGQLDTSFGKDGIASIPTPFSDNLRRGLLEEDGSYFTTAYASVGASNQPFISKFDSTGKADASWGDDGLATAYPGGLGGFAEAYGIKKDSLGNYLISAYGYRGGRTGDAASNGVDALLFSLKPDGTLNKDWADRGLLAYHVGDDGNGSADRHRNHVVLPDGRIVGVGSSGVSGSINALITVTPPGGTPGTVHSIDLGGTTDDVFWGVTTVGNGYQVVAAGVGNNDAKLATLDLTPESSTTAVALAKASTTFGGANTATVNLKVGGAAAAGEVTVSVDGKKVQSVSVSNSGTASVALPKTLSVGKHTVTAELAPAPGIASSKASASVTVNKAGSATSLKLSASKIKKSKRATATIKITGSGVPSGYYPTGTVTIHDGSKKIATVKVTAGNKGTVKVKLPKITKKGNHTIKASYAGNAQLKASSATAKIKVTK